MVDAAREALGKEPDEGEKPGIGEAKEHDGLKSWWYYCGVCKYPIDKGDKYCRSCGKRVKWDG